MDIKRRDPNSLPEAIEWFDSLSFEEISPMFGQYWGCCIQADEPFPLDEFILGEYWVFCESEKLSGDYDHW